MTEEQFIQTLKERAAQMRKAGYTTGDIQRWVDKQRARWTEHQNASNQDGSQEQKQDTKFKGVNPETGEEVEVDIFNQGNQEDETTMRPLGVTEEDEELGRSIRTSVENATNVDGVAANVEQAVQEHEAPTEDISPTIFNVSDEEKEKREKDKGSYDEYTNNIFTSAISKDAKLNNVVIPRIQQTVLESDEAKSILENSNLSTEQKQEQIGSLVQDAAQKDSEYMTIIRQYGAAAGLTTDDLVYENSKGLIGKFVDTTVGQVLTLSLGDNVYRGIRRLGLQGRSTIETIGVWKSANAKEDAQKKLNELTSYSPEQILQIEGGVKGWKELIDHYKAVVNKEDEELEEDIMDMIELDRLQASMPNVNLSDGINPAEVIETMVEQAPRFVLDYFTFGGFSGSQTLFNSMWSQAKRIAEKKYGPDYTPEQLKKVVLSGEVDEYSAIGSALTTAALERLPLGKVGKLIGATGKKNVIQQAKNFIKKPISYSVINGQMKDFVKKLPTSLYKTGKEMFKEGATEFAQYFTEEQWDALGSQTDAKFDMGEAYESFLQGAVSMGGFHSTPKIAKQIGVEFRASLEKLAKLGSKRAMKEYNSVAKNVISQYENGEISEDEMYDKLNVIKRTYDALKSIPDNIHDDKKPEAVKLITEYDNLSRQIKESNDILAEPLKERREVIANELRTLAGINKDDDSKTASTEKSEPKVDTTQDEIGSAIDEAVAPVEKEKVEDESVVDDILKTEDNALQQVQGETEEGVLRNERVEETSSEEKQSEPKKKTPKKKIETKVESETEPQSPIEIQHESSAQFKKALKEASKESGFHIDLTKAEPKSKKAGTIPPTNPSLWTKKEVAQEFSNILNAIVGTHYPTRENGQGTIDEAFDQLSEFVDQLNIPNKKFIKDDITEAKKNKDSFLGFIDNFNQKHKVEASPLSDVKIELSDENGNAVEVLLNQPVKKQYLVDKLIERLDKSINKPSQHGNTMAMSVIPGLTPKQMEQVVNLALKLIRAGLQAGKPFLQSMEDAAVELGAKIAKWNDRKPGDMTKSALKFMKSGFGSELKGRPKKAEIQARVKKEVDAMVRHDEKVKKKRLRTLRGQRTIATKKGNLEAAQLKSIEIERLEGMQITPINIDDLTMDEIANIAIMRGAMPGEFSITHIEKATVLEDMTEAEINEVGNEFQEGIEQLIKGKGTIKEASGMTSYQFVQAFAQGFHNLIKGPQNSKVVSRISSGITLDNDPDNNKDRVNAKGKIALSLMNVARGMGLLKYKETAERARGENKVLVLDADKLGAIVKFAKIGEKGVKPSSRPKVVRTNKKGEVIGVGEFKNKDKSGMPTRNGLGAVSKPVSEKSIPSKEANPEFLKNIEKAEEVSQVTINNGALDDFKDVVALNSPLTTFENENLSDEARNAKKLSLEKVINDNTTYRDVIIMELQKFRGTNGRYYTGVQGVEYQGPKEALALLDLPAIPVTEQGIIDISRHAVRMFGPNITTEEQQDKFAQMKMAEWLDIAANFKTDLRWQDAHEPWLFLRAIRELHNIANGQKETGLPIELDDRSSGMQHLAGHLGHADEMQGVNINNDPNEVTDPYVDLGEEVTRDKKGSKDLSNKEMLELAASAKEVSDKAQQANKKSELTEEQLERYDELADKIFNQKQELTEEENQEWKDLKKIINGPQSDLTAFINKNQTKMLRMARQMIHSDYYHHRLRDIFKNAISILFYNAGNETMAGSIYGQLNKYNSLTTDQIRERDSLQSRESTLDTDEKSRLEELNNLEQINDSIKSMAFAKLLARETRRAARKKFPKMMKFMDILKKAVKDGWGEQKVLELKLMLEDFSYVNEKRDVAAETVRGPYDGKSNGIGVNMAYGWGEVNLKDMMKAMAPAFAHTSDSQIPTHLFEKAFDEGKNILVNHDGFLARPGEVTWLKEEVLSAKQRIFDSNAIENFFVSNFGEEGSKKYLTYEEKGEQINLLGTTKFDPAKAQNSLGTARGNSKSAEAKKLDSQFEAFEEDNSAENILKKAALDNLKNQFKDC